MLIDKIKPNRFADQILGKFISLHYGCDMADLPCSLVEQAKYILEELFYAAETGATIRETGSEPIDNSTVNQIESKC